MMTTMLASMILSNSATTSMVLASVAPLLKKIGKDPFSKALLVGVPLAASVGGMGTIIGSPTNAIAAVFLRYGYARKFYKMDVFRFTTALMLTLAGWWLLKSKFITSDSPIEFELPSQNESDNNLIKKERRIVLAILAVNSNALADQFSTSYKCFCSFSGSHCISNYDWRTQAGRYPENSMG